MSTQKTNSAGRRRAAEMAKRPREVVREPSLRLVAVIVPRDSHFELVPVRTSPDDRRP